MTSSSSTFECHELGSIDLVAIKQPAKEARKKHYHCTRILHPETLRQMQAIGNSIVGIAEVKRSAEPGTTFVVVMNDNITASEASKICKNLLERVVKHYERVWRNSNALMDGYAIHSEVNAYHSSS